MTYSPASRDESLVCRRSAHHPPGGGPVRILVTGGAGFVGSKLVASLLANGHHIIVLDNFSTGLRESIAPFERNTRFELNEGDVRDEALAIKASKSVDAVVHLAAIADVPYSVKHPRITHDVNVGGTVNLLNACRSNKVGAFIFAEITLERGHTRPR